MQEFVTILQEREYHNNELEGMIKKLEMESKEKSANETQL
jgi:hypothetical protein